LAYRKMAELGKRMWIRHGALQYVECVGDDLEPSFGLPYPRLMKLKPGEVPVFSWIAYRSRAHRDQVYAKVMTDPAMAKMTKKMPFDPKRMAYAGFKVLVEA
jgi:uncharacterized protein YbaA (DUF1428 family)